MASLCAHQSMPDSDLLDVMKHAHAPWHRVLNFQSLSLNIIEFLGTNIAILAWNLEAPFPFFVFKGSSNAG